MKKITLILGLLICSLSYAQDRSVQGLVLDGAYEENPLAFANVTVKGLDITAETSLEGNFELHLLEGNYTLVVDFTGYEPLEIENVMVEGADIELGPVVLNALKPDIDLVANSEGQ
jgi:hypothetical protein